MNFRSGLAIGGACLALVLGGAACSDDDGDPDDIDTPDLDPGEGEDLPGDSEDEGSDQNGDETPDLDPGEGEDLPGDSDDEG